MAYDRPSRPFPAAYPGFCLGCFDQIEEGDTIRMQHGQARHEGCVEVPDDDDEVRDDWE